MICTITYNGKAYTEQEFKRLVEASFSNYKATQSSQDAVEAYNTVIKQADALLGFLNQYGVKLDDDTSFEPKEISEEGRKEITKELMKIDGLANNHFNYFVSHVFNTAAKDFNVNGKSITSESELKQQMKEELIKMFDTYEATLDNVAEKLNAIGKPDDNVVQLNLKKIQVAKEKLKLVKDNFDTIAEVGLNKLYKFANIKVNTVTNEDGTTTTTVEEADNTAKIADMEEESSEDSVTDFEETNSERDENYSQTSLERNPKNSVRKELRLLMAGIPLTDDKGNNMNTVMGIPAYVDFDTVFDTVIALMADKSFTFNEAVAYLKDNADVRPWLNEFVNRLEKADAQVKNQFLSTMSNHALTMHYVQYSFDQDGNLTLKVMNTNSAELRRKTLANWKNDFLGSDLVDADVETGQYFVNKNEAQRLLEEHQSWFNNAPKPLKYSKARQLVDIHKTAAINNRDEELKDKKTIDILGFKADDFKDGEVKKFSITTKIDDKYDTKELRVKKVNGQLEYIVGKPTTPAISRALQVKNISTDGKTIPIMEYSNMSAEEQAEAVGTVLEWLDAFGIDMHPNAIHRILSGDYYVNKDTKLTPDKFFAKTSSEHQPIGILAGWLQKAVDADNTIISADFKENHPFRDNAIENGLAKFQAKYVENVSTSSFRSGKKSIYGYTAYKFATDRFIDLKNNNGNIREQLNDIAFSKNAAWLQWLENPAVSNAFSISHLDLNALKEAGKKIFGDNGITSLADADHELVKWGLFMDMKQGDTSVKFTIDGMEFPMRIASMLFPTMSDKSTMLTVKAPMFKLNDQDYYEYNVKNQRFEIKAEVLQLAFNQLVLPEIERIIDFKTKNPDGTNVKGYDKGAKMLMFLPGLNDLQVKYEMNDGSLWEGNLQTLLSSPNFKLENLNDELKAQIYPEINNLISTLVQQKIKVWEDNELITKNEDGSTKFKFVDAKYLKDTEKYGKLPDDTKTSVIAFDYVINQMIGNANTYMTVIGDPAVYYKSSSKSFIEQSEDTFINVGKRLAAMIAPGVKLADSKNETYHQIFLADRVSVSQNIGFLTKVLDNKEFDVEEYNKIMQIGDEGEREKELNKAYPNSAGYFSIESTDAQEYTTWQEHLHVLRQMGKTSDSVLSLTDKDLDIAEELFTNNTSVEDMTDAQKEILSKVLQPIKPVYTGQTFDKEQGLMRMMYIKSSSFPLIPQMTAGTELDKLRIALQDFQKRGLKVRASYQTANKVGALKSPLKIFDENGKIKNISQQDLENASLVLNRKDFKIQQDVPFKSGKRSEDTTTLGSQLTKVLFGNGMMDESGFMMDGTSYSGKKLQEIYNQTFTELYNLRKQKFYNELGIDEATNKPTNVKETALKLQKLLKEEAFDRGWSKQDIDGLEIEFVYDNDGTITDYKFKLPLWMSANSNRIEALLNAIIDNRLVKMKFPGNAYVAGSEEGFKIQKDFKGIDKSQIVWLNNKFNGELQAADYIEEKRTNKEGKEEKVLKLKSAQILVASKFRDNDGNLIDLLERDGKNYKYVIQTKKGFQLNEKMFDKELLDMITFRIPTSGHMSGSKVTIAGFLPAQNGDLIITPKNFTKQMGQDFDVDKLSSYQLWHTQEEDGKFRPVKAGDKVKNVKEKLLQNKLVNIHLAVFGNSKPSVQKKINAILSIDYAKEQAEMIDKINQKDNKFFTPLSDEYQKQKMALGASGKIGTGAYSLDVTSHSLFEQAKANGNQLQLLNDGLPFKMSFGSIDSNGKLGEADTKVVSKKDYFIARMSSLEGNDTVLDNLTELLKSDEETGLVVLEGQTENYPELRQILDDYNKLQRPIANVLSERQNISVDNEKEQVLGKVNLNSYTMDVDKVLCMLGFDKGEDGNSLSFLFLSQPIIKDYVAEMSKATSNIKGYSPNAEAEVIKKLKEKYFDSVAISSMDEMSVYHFDNEVSNVLTSEKMYDELTKNKTGDRLNNYLQLAALNRFLMLKGYGLALRNIQSTINTDSKGLGKSIPEIGERIKNVTALSNTTIKNSEKLIGDYLPITIYTNIEQKKKEGYIHVTEDLMIKPTTSVGAVSLNALLTANTLWEKHFPYNTPTMSRAIDEVMSLISKSEASEAKKAEKQHMIIKEVKKYLNSVAAQRTLIKSGTATDERYRLMLDDKKTGKVSLAKYLAGIVSMHPQLKDNKLIQRFNYDIDYTGKPSMILYENTAGSNFDEDGLNNALLELLGTDLTLPAFNGEIYSAKKLAQDLINYALLEGGVQEATQFAKFIPVSYLEQMGFTKELNKINYDTTTVFGFKENGPSDFAIQFARNNPTSLPKLLMEEKTASGKLKSNISITDAGYNSKNAPNFIAFRVKGKDYLWIKMGNEYKPLTVAVSKGNQGQKVFAYDINPNQQQRQISKGRVRDVAPPIPNEPVNDSAVSELINSERFGLGQDSFTTILNNVINTSGLPDNITVILKQLISKVDPNTTIKLVSGLNSNGKYKEGVIQINKEYAENATNEQLARTILKETVHSVTDELILKHTDENGQLEPKDGVPGAQAARDIITLFERANTALSSGKYAAKYKSMREKFEKLKAGEDVGFDPEEKRILYGTANIKEFIEMMLTQPEFQQAMSEIKIGSSNTTLMDKLRNFIKSVLTAIGVEPGTLTDEAIKSIFQLIEESKPTQTQSTIREYTPEKLTKENMPPNGIFVFGSNTEGRHGKGAALTAKNEFGAKYGQAEGLQGKSYAIVTKNLKEGERSKHLDAKGEYDPLDYIDKQIGELISYAIKNPDKKFYVTKLGTMNAGWTVKEIGEIWNNQGVIPNNIVLPKEFEDSLDFGNREALPTTTTQPNNEVVNNITTQLNKSKDLNNTLDLLESQGYVIKNNNSTLFDLGEGRDAILFNINNTIIPVYRSSQGTSSKTKGEWYPFFFNTNDWVVKGMADTYKEGYNNPIIKQLLDSLNKNYKYDKPKSKINVNNRELLNNFTTDNFNFNNNGVYDFQNYYLSAMILKSWQENLGNIDVSGYEKYINNIASNLKQSNPNLSNKIDAAANTVLNLFNEIQTTTTQPSNVITSAQTDLNQEVYGKVKTNLSQLIVRENAEFNNNPDAVTYPDEINMSEFNGYPKIINFLNEASITDNQLKFFAAHQEYIEALLNETGATDMNELLEAIQEEEVEIEPTESQIEFGMSDSTIADIENEVAETENMISESKAGNDIMLFPGVPANAGQTKAIEKLNNFVKDKGRQVFVLKGRGGTGKTTIIKKILEKLEGKEIAAATLGHKAKGVLQSSMGSKVKAGTIASAIGIRPDRKNPGQFIKVDSKYFNKTKSPFYNADVIIIDECSMLTQEMVNDIINFSKNPNVKIIFMGDNVQLPPMEADKNLQNKDSASFTANTKPEYTATLTERMRQGEDSPIVSLSDVIAANVESKEPELRPIKNRTNKFDAKKNTGILFETKDSMVTQLTNDLQNDKENTKIITFTHAEKNSMNNLAREILWGKGNTNEFNKGEILINNDNKEQSGATSQDVFNGEQYSVLSFTPLTISVKEISEDYSISNKSLPGYTLKVQNETGQIITIQVLSPKVKQQYSDIQNNNRNRALKMGGTTMEDVWWNNEDKHVNVDYGYAAISHDAQGSTYNNVYVMEDNILGVQNASIKTKNQSLYVAVTRPRYKAVIVSNKNASNVSIGEEYTTKGLNIDTRGKSFEPKEISEEDINNLPRLNCE